MRIVRSILTVFIFALFLLFLPSAVDAQQIVVNYRFLETQVVDISGKPVAGAAVETFGYQQNILQTLQTNENGQLGKGLPIARGHVNTIGFRVSKPGYYSYEDIFGLLGGPFSELLDKPVRLELLAVPTVENGNPVGEQRKREFMLAVKKGDTGTTVKLLREGVNANTTTSDLIGVPGPANIPAIVWASIYGEDEMIISLLAAGADVSNKDKLGNKALLHYLNAHFYLSRFPRSQAERTDPFVIDEKVVQLLIESGADIKAMSDHGETTLMLAVANGTTKMVETLLEKGGVPIDAKDEFGYTALIRAVGNSRAGTLRFYKDMPINPRDFRTARRSNSRVEIINLLLKSGADPNLVTYYSGECRNALMGAASLGHLDLVQTLIANKANVNVTCQSGDTALVHAVRNYKVKIVKALIDAGANVKGKQGQLALTYAKQNQSTQSQEIITLLESAQAN